MTVGELRNDLARFMSFGNAATGLYAGLTTEQKYEIDAIMARGLRQFYNPPPLAGDRITHRWSFLRKSYVIVLNAPSSPTDTVTVVAGVGTMTGGTLPTWIAGCAVRFNGAGQLYSIASRDSTTQFTLDDTSAAFAALSTLTFYDGVRALPDDFGGIEGNVTYGMGAINGYLRQDSDEHLRMVASGAIGGQVAAPQMFAIRPKTWPTSGGTGTRQEVVMWPLPDQAYAVRMTYKVLPQLMTSASDCPLGATDHGGTIIASCLAIAEEYAVTEKSEYRSVLWPQALASSVMLDRGSLSGNIGYNGDRTSDIVNWNPLHEDGNSVTTYTP